MKKRMLLATALAATMALSACSSAEPAAAPATTAASAAATTAVQAEAPDTASAEVSPYDQADTIKLGVVCARTGSKTLQGDFTFEASTMAVDEMNANGGLLGKKVELIVEDEIETQQDAINAVNKLLSRGDISGFFGCMGSTNCIAVSPMVLEAKVPFMAGGSSYNIIKENNPYMWQARLTDDKTGELFAKAATQVLNMKNPALLYITGSFGQGLADKTLEALKNDYGIEPGLVISFNENEKQFAPFITQVANSDCDGMICISSTVEAAMIMKQVQSIGLDIPCLGSNAFVGAIGLETAGDAANGWFGFADWCDSVQSEKGKKFISDFYERWGTGTEMAAAVSYDSLMLLADAIETCGSADPQKINDTLATIKDHEGVMGTLSASDSRSFMAPYLLVRIEDGQPVIQEVIEYGK